MTDRDGSSPPPTPSKTGAENAAAEDLACLQAALEERQRERVRRLTRSHAVETDVQARLQHAELRVHQSATQIEATQRSAQAMRVRLEGDLQATRARAEAAQAALAANQAASEDLRISNAELSTAIDAAQWRLGELEAENTAQREALLHLEEARHAALERLAELERTVVNQQQAAAAAAVQQAEVTAALDALHTRAAELQELLDHLQAERNQLLAARDEANAHLADQCRERDGLLQRLAALEAERTTLCEREAVLRGELEDLRTGHNAARAIAEQELTAFRTQLLADEQQRRHLEEELAAAHAERERIEAQHQSERDALTASARSLEETLQQRADQLGGVENELQRLQAAHAAELNDWQDTLAQRESELVASRDALARQLADERALAANISDDAAALAARVERLDADLQAARERCQQLEQEVVAAQAERVEIEAQHRAERAVLEEEAQQLRVAQAEAVQRWQEQSAQDAGERETLTSRLTLVQDELRQRDARIERLHAELARLETEQTQALQTTVEAGRRREEEWRATSRTLREELECVRRNLRESDAARAAARQRTEALTEQLEKQAADLELFRERAEAAAALGQHNAGARTEAEQAATDLEQRAATPAHERQTQKESDVVLHRHDAMAAQIVELDNERSGLSLRVDELTALTAQLERECERLRRDRGSTEEIRRLKADNARLEAKIVDLDRQRTEAVQRHSAAVAGYMVELNQRSEALRARDTELQKLIEELTLVKQSCADAVSDLAAQRQQQATLERQLAELRAAPRPASGPPPAEAADTTSATSPRPDSVLAPPARPYGAKPARRPAVDEASTAPASITHLPVTVIHLEDNQPLCHAVRDVVARVPGSRYLNAFDPSALNAPGSSMLAINLLGRTYDSLEAIASFIAGDTFHKNVFAYCADGATGFSFGTADFFSQPVDPDACVSQLLESCGAIHRLLVASENFVVVSGLRAVLSRMRSSVSAALDLRQVIDLFPMVAPDVVLVDLSLPRGDGLRLVSRLRADPKTSDLPLVVLLPPQANGAEFRQQALRAARDLPMSAAQLTTALSRRLGAQHAAASTASQPPATTALA